MLKNLFTELVLKYSSQTEMAEELWLEIEEEYSDPNRHYHTLQHLFHLIEELRAVKTDIRDWDAILFAVYYHDIVYNGVSSDNEQKSSILATHRLQQIRFPAERISLSKYHILSTNGHRIAENDDTNLFTDADLSILGQDWDRYLVYAQNIRKEFKGYPDAIYNQGRIHVLEHFLKMKDIFKTEPFFDRYEKKARKNLSNEIKLLNI
ncbi:MAG: HD domain-containing protein [Flavisolibacter sp.]